MENKEKIKKKELLLEEYKLNVDLWQHDDNLRQQRTSNFLTVNTILIAIVSALIGVSDEFEAVVFYIGIVMSLFGMLISFFWYKILKRNQKYIRFRRLQLYHIEEKLKPMSTFQNTFRIFYQNEKDVLKHQEEFLSVKSGKISSTVYESMLPILIIGFWFCAIIGLVVLITKELQQSPESTALFGL